MSVSTPKGTPNSSSGRQRPNFITFGKPRPYLDPPGTYRAECIAADFDWSRRYKRNQGIFTFAVPRDYRGRPYVGDLCGFASLGNRQDQPFASPGSKFYALWREVNGDDPSGPTLTRENLKSAFVGRTFEIEVETVIMDREQQKLQQPYSVVRKFRLAQTTKTLTRATTPTRITRATTPTSKPINLYNQVTNQPINHPSQDERSTLVLGGNSGQPPPMKGAGAAEIVPASSQNSIQTKAGPSCRVHGQNTKFWKRGTDSVCGRCHPNPRGAEMS